MYAGGGGVYACAYQYLSCEFVRNQCMRISVCTVQHLEGLSLVWFSSAPGAPQRLSTSAAPYA